ncbi:MAG: hypothetical protein JWM85_304 [Acidimicrobiaceae bacterium]|nr:hypothetical protein [Acidimicrobiaceae bacterium]
MSKRETKCGYVSRRRRYDTNRSLQERYDAESQIDSMGTERGRLVALVRVRVYEHGAFPAVEFPAESPIGPETDEDEIDSVRARAADALRKEDD